MSLIERLKAQKLAKQGLANAPDNSKPTLPAVAPDEPVDELPNVADMDIVPADPVPDHDRSVLPEAGTGKQETPSEPKSSPLKMPLGARRPIPKKMPEKVEPIVLGPDDFVETQAEIAAAVDPQPVKTPFKRKTLGRAPTKAVVDEVATTAPAEPEKAPIKLPGVLGAMKDRAAARTERPAPTAVTKAAHALVSVTYSPEDMMRDLQALEEMAPDDMSEDADDIEIAAHTEAMAILNMERGAILTKGANTIEEVFQGEMNDLAYKAASDPSMATVSQVVKITFLRLKSAPNAWAFMELTDRAKIIAGMRAMAVKRNAITSKKKPAEAKAFSEAVDMMAALPESDNLASLVEGFDLGGF